jgi:hypothetical protein
MKKYSTEKANQNYIEIPPHPFQNGNNQENNDNKWCGEKEPLHIVGRM